VPVVDLLLKMNIRNHPSSRQLYRVITSSTEFWKTSVVPSGRVYELLSPYVLQSMRRICSKALVQDISMIV